MLSAPHEGAQIFEPDEWWVERRLLARKLLDSNAVPSLSDRAGRRAADQGELMGRARVHGRLDRASLSQGSTSRHRSPALATAMAAPKAFPG
jgi:hypothetical protein